MHCRALSTQVEFSSAAGAARGASGQHFELDSALEAKRSAD
jgi:hypothetical protein